MKPKPLKPTLALRELYRPPGSSLSAGSPALYILRLRSQLSFRAPAMRPQIIPVDFRNGEKTHAEPVKITHC
jgi:hypothetical protein